MPLRSWLLLAALLILGTVYGVSSYYAKPQSICNHPGLQMIENKQSVEQVQSIMGQPLKGDHDAFIYAADNYSGQIRIAFDAQGKVVDKVCGYKKS